MGPVNTRIPAKRGFATAHALCVGCVVAWVGLAMTSPPATPPGPADTAPAADDATETRTEEGVVEAVVTLSSGRQLEGVLVSDTPESVVIRINGIDTTLPRWRVAGVRVLPPVAERYRELRATVDDTDVRARLALVEWLRGREAYRFALRELEGILEVDPDNPEARTLRTWLRNHLELTARRRVDRRERATPPAPRLPVLTEEQINRVRVYEIDLNAPTRVIVPDDIMRELMVRHPTAFPVDADEREAILKLNPMDKLRLIFKHKARDLYDRVRVLEDPPAISVFKTRVHGVGGWIVNACASNRCHGGTQAGRLQLLNQRANSDQTAYTNLLILDRFRLADGTPLINHREPARSPLLHMAMPRHASLYPHPAVDDRGLGENWRPVFRTTNDRRFREAAGWIASLYNPRPDYGIDYPPGADDEPTTHDPAPEPDERPGPDARPDTPPDTEPEAEPGPSPARAP